jgi:hypothetical protein
MANLRRPKIVYYVARTARLAYLQIAKAGCTSVRAAFCRLDRPEIPEAQLLVPKAFVQNPTWTDIVPLDDPFVAQCYRFTFVRNPIERYCSFFRSKIQDRPAAKIKPNFLELGFREGMTFEESITVAERTPAGFWDRHFAPQTYFVFDTEGKSRVEYVGQLEKMEEALDEIQKATGVRLWTPQLNVTRKEPAPARELISKEAVARLEKLYAADFETFGYPRSGMR